MEREAYQGIKLLDSNFSTAAKLRRKNCGPPLFLLEKVKGRGRLNSHLWKALMQYLNIPSRAMWQKVEYSDKTSTRTGWW